MTEYEWLDTANPEIITCKHNWTGFAKCVTLKETNEFQCMDCGVRIINDLVICRSGKLYYKKDFK